MLRYGCINQLVQAHEIKVVKFRKFTVGNSDSASSMASSTPTATTLFRRLCWDGTVPIEVKIDAKELPAGSDRTLESFYIRAPRVSYLPLLIQEVKSFLFDLVLDEASAKDMKTDDWWFEAEGGALLKW